MKNGKYENGRSSKKLMVLLLVLALLIGATLGGTLAYLTFATGTEENTFVAGNVGTLELLNTKDDNFVIVPGQNLQKNTQVKFSGNTIPAYVFLEVTGTNWTDATTNNKTTYSIGDNAEMSWDLEAGWTPVTGVNDVYYREVDANAGGTWYIVQHQEVTDGNGGTKNICEIAVSTDISETDIANYASTLNFKAYAIQSDGFDGAAAAWTALNNQLNPNP